MLSAKGNRRAFLILETIAALMIFSITASLFWQGWSNLNQHGQSMSDRLSRERAIANARALISRNLLTSLPIEITEDYTITAIFNQNIEVDGNMLLVEMENNNGMKFSVKIAK